MPARITLPCFWRGHAEGGVILCRQAETGAWLSAVLTSANLISIFVLQKLAAVLAEKEQMKASQGALLRQVSVPAAMSSLLSCMYLHSVGSAMLIHDCRSCLDMTLHVLDSQSLRLPVSKLKSFPDASTILKGADSLLLHDE